MIKVYKIKQLQEQMVEPAVNGTKNVIIAAAEARVRRVVFTSSIGAVYMDPNRGPDVVVDESCWSDLDFCKDTKVIRIFALLLNLLNFEETRSNAILNLRCKMTLII